MPIFEFPPFRPHALVRGGHLQTILGNYLPSLAIGPGVLHEVALPDGDHIALHDDGPHLAGTKPGPGVQHERIDSANSFPGSSLGTHGREAPASPARGRREPPGSVFPGGAWEQVDPTHLASGHFNGSGNPTAILLHGLGGCHQSTYMQRCSVRLRASGVRVFRMDLRGCGAGVKLARHPIHAGRSEDAAAALDYVHNLCPGSPIHLVGFSMGANIVLKLAGELGAAAPPHLASVMAVGPPIDLIECSKNMQRGWNRLYDRRFARNLVRFIQHRSQIRPDALCRPLVPQPRRLVDFDAMFTAPLAGFADTDDYYTQASSARLLPRIAVPTLILTAASDPIVPVQPFEQASYSPTTQLHIAPCGGHLGFVAARNHDPDHRWLDWRVVDWVRGQGSGVRGPESGVGRQGSGVS